MSSVERPKHQIVKEWLREQILLGVYTDGAQIPTEFELAKQFSVSRQTVRQAVGVLEADGLLERTRGSGTYVRHMRPDYRHSGSGKTRRVGVVTTYLDDYIFPAVIHGIEEVLTASGYLLTLGLTYNKCTGERQALQKLLKDGVDGLIIEGTKSALPTPNAALLDCFRAQGVPLVFINGTYMDAPDSFVVMDDVKSGELLAAYFAQKGHRRIGGIFKSDDIQGIKRYEGVILGTQAAGLLLDEDATLWYTTEDLMDLFEGTSDAQVLRRLRGMTAVICYNDEIAVKLISLLRRAGREVPKDLSLASFDNSSLASPMLYNLTSVTYPAHEIGRTAAQVLLRCMDNPSNKEKIKIEPKVIERISVATL